MIIRAATSTEQAAMDQGGDLLIAEVEGEVAGFAALQGGDLREVLVEPEYRGEGIGTALVEAAVHHARRCGLSLTATAEPGGIGFLERCGFAREAEADQASGGSVRMSR